MLAGLLKAPTTYAPTNDLERSRDRANVVIGAAIVVAASLFTLWRQRMRSR